MTRNSGFLKIGLMVLAGAAIAPSAFAQDNAPVLLTMKFKAGDVSKYATTTSIGYSIPGLMASGIQSKMAKANPGKPAPVVPPTTNVTVSGTQIIKVLTVQNNGTGELQVTTDIPNPMAAMMGQGNRKEKPQVSTMVCDSLGHLSKGGMGFLSTGMLVFPTKPIKPGESWTETTGISQLAKNAPAKVTFIGYEQVGKYRTAHLRTVVSAPMNTGFNTSGGLTTKGQGDANMNGTMNIIRDVNFAVAEGKLIKMTATVDTNMTISGFMGSSSATKGKAKAAGSANNGMKVTSRTTQEVHLTE